MVDHASIDVRQGEIVGLLGPNGAGKTTSFYMITGLIVPNDGKIFLDDEDITKLPMFKRSQKGIGYLAQEASVFRHMSVEDNIMSVMEMSNQFTKEERKQRLEDLLDEFNLHKVRKSKGIQLSGGERRRVALCRLLLQKRTTVIIHGQAVRVVRSGWLNRLLSACHVPLVGTSANLHGQPVITTWRQGVMLFADQNVAVVRGRKIYRQKPSSLVQIEKPAQIKILRDGSGISMK